MTDITDKQIKQSASPLFQNGAIMSVGLSKREYFAGLTLQGMASNPSYIDANWEIIAKEALKSSDALIKELSK